MTIRTFAPSLGATGLTATGGTATALIGLNSDYSKLKLAIAGSSSIKDRSTLSYSATPAKASSNGPNGYTQERTGTQLLSPKLLANDKITYNSISVQTSFDVETTDAEKLELILIMAQSMAATATREFYLRGAVE